MSPGPMQISDWQIAEINAARWMKHWGYSDAEVTGGGADGGIDVTSHGAIAQVKFKASQVGGPDLQRLAGAGFSHPGKKLMFFSGTSYSAQALAVAADAHIALFTYRLDGAVSAVNRYAETIAARQHPPSDTSRKTGILRPSTYNALVTTPAPVLDNEPKETHLGVWFFLTLVAGLVCFFSGLTSQDGASGFRAFVSFILLLLGLALLFVAWVLWGALTSTVDGSDR